MILTVTLNPAIDKILVLENFRIHKLHRLDKGEFSFLTPGGKGVNIAHNLKLLGDDVIATGFAAGYSGHMLCDFLRQENITTSFIFTEGNTRTNISILDRKKETLTEINDFGQRVNREDIHYFIENFDRILNRIKLVVIAGSLPVGAKEDLICSLIQRAKKLNIKTILHTNPDYTNCYLAGSPEIIIPDMRSNHILFGKEIDGIPKFLETGRYILTHSADTELVLFIHRLENVVAITREKSYILRPKDLNIINMLGYGDAFIAGLIHAQQEGKSMKDMLVYASAAGLADVEELYKEIRDISIIQKNIQRIDLEEVE